MTPEREAEIRESFKFYPSFAAVERGLAVELLAEIDRLQAQTTWQPISTCPRDSKLVLLWCRDRLTFPFVGHMSVDPAWNGGYDSDGELCKPTHWMPLPPAPTTERA